MQLDAFGGFVLGVWIGLTGMAAIKYLFWSK
jgi:hypothetical protein